MIKTFTVDEPRKNELQKLAIEVESRQGLITFMIERGMDVNSEQFKKYEKEYRDFYFQYEQAKSAFEKEIVRPQFHEVELVSWNLDFSTNEVTVTLKD